MTASNSPIMRQRPNDDLSRPAAPPDSDERGRVAGRGSRFRRLLGISLALAALLPGFHRAAHAQTIGGPVFGVNQPPGVYISTQGNVSCRQEDPTQDLAAMRIRARAAADAAKKEKLSYISLPRLFAQVRALRDAGKEVPAELRYLGGMTQIRYVFVYPDEKDLMIAGPAEPWVEDKEKFYASGKRSGRPILQLDDLVAAMRTADIGRGQVFGCGIYPSPDSEKVAERVAREMARATHEERMAALTSALGPQQVRIFGTEADTRLAFICVAADYELKRFAMGLHRSPVANLGNAVDNSRTAANKFWFEPSYDPLLVSADANAYAIRGQRLAVKAGAFDFDARGATPHAMAWAATFSRDIPPLAASVPLFAELQNITDESLLANLIRHDGLDRKAAWDMSWILDDKAFPIERISVPKTADTLVSATNGSLVCGGVMLEVGPLVIEKNRQADDKAPWK